jgi:hypothetical protein
MRGFLIRFALALVLVFATWNPWGHSYTHWVRHFADGFTPAKAVAGVVLTIGWVAALTAAWRSLGFIMTGLAAALLAALLWMLVDSARGSLGASAVSSLALVGISLVLAVATSWSAFRRDVAARFGGSPQGGARS